MSSVMTNRFAYTNAPTVQRSTFKSQFRHVTSFDADYLIPFYCAEAHPADTYQVQGRIFSRLSTLEKPIMDNIQMDTFFFAVPNRLLWNHWKAFMGEQDDPLQPTIYEPPCLTSPSGGWLTGSLHDYFALPLAYSGIEANSFWHRAYYMIYNEWFRDENLIDPLPEAKGDTDIDSESDPIVYELQRRGKRHDYFTSCLPWPQKGQAVDVPVGGTAPVFGTGKVLGLQTVNQQMNADLYGLVADTDGWMPRANPNGFGATMGAYVSDTSDHPDGLRGIGAPMKSAYTNNFEDSGLYADLSESTGVTINTLRQAVQLQRMAERDAQGGTRYTELIRSHWGVISPDARMQRPEYLGGSNAEMSIFPVVQTGEKVLDTPQGNLAAMATIVHDTGFSKSFTEHCTIIGILNVRADLTYQQGINRMFTRKTKYDYPWPTLAHLGEQAVLNKEIYAIAQSATNPSTGVPFNEEVFGYQERYAECKYEQSIITGNLRSNVTGTWVSLDVWHVAQDFGALPVLGKEFIESDTPIGRVIAVPGSQEFPQHQFIADIRMSIKKTRALPVYARPGFMDHF